MATMLTGGTAEDCNLDGALLDCNLHSLLQRQQPCCHVTASQFTKLVPASTCVSPQVSGYNPIQLVCVGMSFVIRGFTYLGLNMQATTQHNHLCSLTVSTCGKHTIQHTYSRTYNYLYITFTFSGTSCKSFSFFLGRITRFSPARCAAKTLSFIPPT